MTVLRDYPFNDDPQRQEIRYRFDPHGPTLFQDFIVAVKEDFLTTDRLFIDVKALNPRTLQIAVVRHLAPLQVKVTGIVGKKHFEWKWEGAARKEICLSVGNFIIYSHVKVIRDGKEIDRAMIVEPRGDRHYFCGLEKLNPGEGNYFPDVPVDCFEPLDVIEFGFSSD